MGSVEAAAVRTALPHAVNGVADATAARQRSAAIRMRAAPRRRGRGRAGAKRPSQRVRSGAPGRTKPWCVKSESTLQASCSLMADVLFREEGEQKARVEEDHSS